MHAHFPGPEAPDDGRKPAPDCSSCGSRLNCYFQPIIVRMAEKAQIFLELSRNRDAEDLIESAYHLCDLTRTEGVPHRD